MRLALACSSALGLDLASACALAASVECLHNASLVQDDLQDRSEIRRGQVPVAMKFGPDVALGLTNRLVSAAFVSITTDPLLPSAAALIRQLHLAIAETVDGQTQELLGITDLDSINQRLNAAMKKSGPLFALSLELPLIAAGHHEHVDTAHQAALQFGLGYQIIDDLEDQASDAAVGSDGNIVLAIRAEHTGDPHTAEQRAARIARDAIENAATLASRLPMQSGMPLIHLIERQRSALSRHES